MKYIILTMKEITIHIIEFNDLVRVRSIQRWKTLYENLFPLG
jgi:hypothetical protein